MTDLQPHYTGRGVTLYHGDCLDVLRTLPDASVDAVVTDPPYGLEFMGKDWDAPWKPSSVGRGVRVEAERADEMTERGKGHSTPGGPFLAARVDSTRVAGKPFQDWCQAWAQECLRVLKPGGHLLAFGGSRTWHRLACAVEDAGFEVRDSIAWLYGSGFPKSLDVSKAIDKDNGRKFEDRFALGRHIRERREALGLTTAEVNGWFGYRDGCQHWERQDRSGARVPTLADWRILRERLDLSDEHLPLVERVEAEREVIGSAVGYKAHYGGVTPLSREYDVTAPATPDAERWQGWGTALKPAFEPIVVARKPLAGTVAANVLQHGTGALNIDGCRVEGGARPLVVSDRRNGNEVYGDGLQGSRAVDGGTTAGRWPTNVVLDDSQAAELDRQSGESSSAKPSTSGRYGEHQDTGRNETYGKGLSSSTPNRPPIGDSGGASRFFPTFRYEAKAPTSERPRVNGTAHPTVKPLNLLRWLVRLVTPPGGTVLEPFAGSGTTAEACVIEGFRCIAIEREADYLPLITNRLNRRTAPVEFLRATGADMGLFEELEGGDTL